MAVAYLLLAIINAAFTSSTQHLVKYTCTSVLVQRRWRSRLIQNPQAIYYLQERDGFF